MGTMSNFSRFEFKTSYGHQDTKTLSFPIKPEPLSQGSGRMRDKMMEPEDICSGRSETVE